MTPEHMHLAVNHIPAIGVACALLPILVGVVLSNKTSLIVGLVLAAVCGWTTTIVMETGEDAYERYEEGPVKPFLDQNVEKFLEIHEERAEIWSKVMYAAAILATISLALTLWRFDIGRWASILVILTSLSSIGAGIWIAESGGKIRRVDLRDTGTTQSSGSVSKESDRDDD